jgi:O-antigen/teichoic acid export membrane protein
MLDTKSSRLKRLSGETLWVLAGSAIAIIGSLGLVRLLTEYLNPTQYGELALALTVANLINQVVMCGLISGIGRFYSIAKEHHALHAYRHDSYLLLARATIAIVSIGLSLILFAYFSSHSNWISLIVVTILFATISSYNSVFSDVQNAARNRSVAAANNSLDTLLKILLSFFALYFFTVSATTVMLAYAFAAVVVFSTNHLSIKYAIPPTAAQTNKSEPKSDVWRKQIWTYAWPFSAWGVFTWGQQASDRWALQLFSSTNEVGVFAVLFQLGYAPVIMLSGLISGFLAPIFFQRAGDATNNERTLSVHRINWRVSTCLLAMTALGFLVAWPLHSYIFALFVSSDYRSYSHLLPWFVLSGGLFATGQMLVLKILSEIRSSVLIIVKIGTALIGITLNILGAWLGGLNGIVIAMVGFSVAYLFWMAWLSRDPVIQKTNTLETES